MNKTHPIPLDAIQVWCFDLDGTLMDSDDAAVEALAHKLRFLGEARAHVIARRMVMFSETPANSLMTLMDVVGLDAVLFGARQVLQGPLEPTLRLVEGVTPALRHLHGLARLAVVTTRSRRDALAFLRQHDLEDLFELVVTQETTRRLKPHPEPVLYAAQHFNAPPEACVMVGDTTMDVLSARRAGAWAVAVLCGFGEPRELDRAGAHLVLASPADLLKLSGGG